MKYTREQLEAMPDRELDAVVAERVMRLNVKGVCACYHCEDDSWGVDDDGSWVGSGYDSMQPVHLHPNAMAPEPGDKTVLGESPVWLEIVPFYSTDIAAAWKVVERITPRAAQVDVWARRGGKYACYVHGVDEELWKDGDFVDDVFVEANTAPRAISIAAVLAVQEATR